MTGTQLITNASETDASSYVTASISPTANNLVLLGVQSGTSSPNTPTVTGAGMTWTQVTTLTIGASAPRRLTLFRCLSASPGSGALTIDFAGQNQVRCMWSVSQFSGVITTGTNGADAVVQSASNSQGGTQTGITVTLSAFGQVTNGAYGFVWREDQPAITAGSGFTELGANNGTDSGYIEAEWKNSNDTSVDWTWASIDKNSMAIAVELGAPTSPTINVFDSITVAETTTPSESYQPSVYDSVGVADNITASMPPLAINVFDSVQISEYTANKPLVSLSDGINVSESIVVYTSGFPISIVDSITVSESVGIHRNLPRWSANWAVSSENTTKWKSSP